MPSNPFLYPKAQHRRRLQPRQYSSYRPYKPYLKDEFGSQCVYCRLPDGMKGQDSFGVDHYAPQKRFPALKTVYSNLFYACNCCNSRKGEFWPTNAQWKAKEFIPNPCNHIMFEHLRYRGAKAEAKSTAGQLAENVLDLNDPDSVQYRELVLDVIRSLEAQKRRLQSTIDSINQLDKAHLDQADQYANEKRSTENELARIERHLRAVAGEAR